MTNDDTTKQVLRKLLSDHVGRSNSITQSQLADALGMNPSTVRSELRRLREERDIPIGNLRDGYFVIDDRDELKDYVAHINSEIQSKRQTIEYTLDAFEDFDPDDIDIDPDPEVEEQTYECAECGREITRDETSWPKSGPRENEPLCPQHYGRLTMQGQT